MSSNDGNDWNAPQDESSKAAEPQSDWSAPNHEPPGDQVPQNYQGGSPTPTGGTELETNDIVAIIVAFLLPGIGQLILGQSVKGLVILGVAIVTCSGGGLVSVASALDAFLVARAQKNRPVDEWEFFPDYKDAFDM